MDNNVIFPNLFIVGAMKAGTTAFYEILDHHNQICMSTIKEPNYYCPDLWGVSAHISYVVNNFSKSNVKSKHNAIIKSDKAYFDLFSKSNSFSNIAFSSFSNVGGTFFSILIEK